MLVYALVVVHLFLSANGFLLLDTNGHQSSGQQNDQYLTVSELDKRLVLLTEQITHKLTLLEKGIPDQHCPFVLTVNNVI
jgi:hypothetical protein